MRKKICVFLIIILMSINFTFNNVNAVEITGNNANKIKLYEIQSNTFLAFDLLKEKILKKLEEDFGYTGKFVKPIIIETTATISEINKDEYIVTIGNKRYITNKSGVTEIYGYDKSWGEEIKVGDSWRVTLEADDIPEDYTMTWSNQFRYEIAVSKLTSYKNIEDAPDTGNVNQEDVNLNENKSFATSVGEFIDGTMQIKAWLEEFGKDQVGTFMKAICKGVRVIFDSLQAEVNKLKILEDGIPEESELKLMYSYEELTGEEVAEDEESQVDYTILNKYTQVSEFKNESKEWQRSIYVRNDEEKEGFSRKKKEKDKETDVDKIVNEGTNIPIIPVELYGMALGNIDILNTDFINGKNLGNSNGFWNLLRNIFSLIVHVVLYISIAILLITLIYHGLSIVYGTIDPHKRADHMEGLKRFAFSLVILVGTIVFMELCTYGSHIFFDIVKMTDENGNITDELPIRVNVNGVYSFSTNVTGYYRFMAVSKSASNQFIYTFIYIVLVGFNIVFAIGMFIRMIIIWFLSIIGPLTAAVKALNIENKIPINFEVWVKWYFKLSMLQIILAGFYRFIMEFALY